MICTDCKGSGKYNPLVGPSEDCSLCRGSGETDFKITEPEVIRGAGIPTPAPHIGVGLPYSNLILAQRWDAIADGLVSGTWYNKFGSTTWAGTPSLGDRIDVRVMDYENEDWVCEFIGNRQNKYWKPGDANYQAALQRAGADPCYSRCRMFYVELSNSGVNLLLDEFEHGRSAIDDLIGMTSHTTVILESVYDVLASVYRVRVK